MTKVTHYEQASWGTQNKLTQDELQRMAKKITSSCRLTEEYHHEYSTNNPEQCKDGKDSVCVLNGSIALTYESDVIPIRYVIHFDCGTVTEIIELLEM